MQEFRQIQRAINPSNTRAYGIKHIQLLGAGFGLQRWRDSRTNSLKTDGRGGAVKHNLSSTKLWPKGDEAVPCVRSSAPAGG